MRIVPMHQWKVPLKYRAMLLFPSGPLGLGGAGGHHGLGGGTYNHGRKCFPPSVHGPLVFPFFLLFKF